MNLIQEFVWNLRFGQTRIKVLVRHKRSSCEWSKKHFEKNSIASSCCWKIRHEKGWKPKWLYTYHMRLTKLRWYKVIRAIDGWLIRIRCVWWRNGATEKGNWKRRARNQRNQNESNTSFIHEKQAQLAHSSNVYRAKANFWTVKVHWETILSNSKQGRFKTKLRKDTGAYEVQFRDGSTILSLCSWYWRHKWYIMSEQDEQLNSQFIPRPSSKMSELIRVQIQEDCIDNSIWICNCTWYFIDLGRNIKLQSLQ